MRLVEIKNNQAVTTSLQVAEDFNKQHKDVLEAYDNLIKTGVAEKSADLFWEDTYIHSQNKQEYRMIYMNRDGFSLLAMGFTGKKALKFKLQYIEQFNQMENYIEENQPKLPTTTMEILELTFTAQKETNQRVDQIEKDITDLKENTVICTGDYNYIGSRVNKRVSEVAKSFGRITNKQRGELYKDINGGIKKITGVNARTQLRQKHYEAVVKFILDWEPSTATKTIVNQMKLDLDDIA